MNTELFVNREEQVQVCISEKKNDKTIIIKETES